MGVRGCAYDAKFIAHVVDLLQTTDISMTLIAERLGCSPTLVHSINHDFVVRDYTGRETFTVKPKIQKAAGNRSGVA